MSSAESDKYIQNQRKLKFAGADLPVTHIPDDLVPVSGIPITEGPRVILSPAFGITREELVAKVQGDVTISRRSAVVLEGHHLTIKNMQVDGALIIRAGRDSHVTVDGLKVSNKGWALVENDTDQEYDETIAIRGYNMEKQETTEYLIHEPGNFVIGADGKVTKVD